MKARVGARAVLALLALVACGETRRTLGEECIRDDDCLSNVCSARQCAGQPPLISGASGGSPTDGVDPPSPDEADAGGDAGARDAADGSADAADGG